MTTTPDTAEDRLEVEAARALRDARRRHALRVYKLLPHAEQIAIDADARRAAEVEVGHPTVDPKSWAFDRPMCSFAFARERAWFRGIEALGVAAPEGVDEVAAPLTSAELHAWSESLPEVHKRKPVEPLAPDEATKGYWT